MGTTSVSLTLMNTLHYGTWTLTLGKSIPTPIIKPEPQETRLAPLTESTLRRNASDASDVLTKMKPEPQDASRVVRFRWSDASFGG